MAEIQLNQIVLADCMDIMRDIPDKYFELAIVDPPYGIGNFSPTGGSVGTSCQGNKWKIYWNDKKPPDAYFSELKRISRDQIIWGANYYNCFNENGGSIVWFKHRGNPQMSKCEIASCSCIGRVEYYSQSWNGFEIVRESPIHPCQKPLDLYRWIIHSFSSPGDKIIDTHSGSGSCAIACHLEKHDFLAIEKDPDYHAASVKRLEEARAQGVLF